MKIWDFNRVKRTIGAIVLLTGAFIAVFAAFCLNWPNSDVDRGISLLREEKFSAGFEQLSASGQLVPNAEMDVVNLLMEIHVRQRSSDTPATALSESILYLSTHSEESWMNNRYVPSFVLQAIRRDRRISKNDAEILAALVSKRKKSGIHDGYTSAFQDIVNNTEIEKN